MGEGSAKDLPRNTYADILSRKRQRCSGKPVPEHPRRRRNGSNSGDSGSPVHHSWRRQAGDAQRTCHEIGRGRKKAQKTTRGQLTSCVFCAFLWLIKSVYSFV